MSSRIFTLLAVDDCCDKLSAFAQIQRNAPKLPMTWPKTARARWRTIIQSKPPKWLPAASLAIPALLLLAQIVQNWVNIPVEN